MIPSFFEFLLEEERPIPREDGSEFDSWENPLSVLTPFLSPPRDSNLDFDWLEDRFEVDRPTTNDPPLIQPDDNIRDNI